ncbi:MAG: glycosyltransferase family 2 protein, partial [Phycisphaerae bacterium]
MIANTEQDRGEFLRLIRRAKAEPFNDDVVQAFYKAYEKAEQHSDDETMAYLMLRCVREGFASKWLNGLAKIFLGRHDFCTVYKCLSDSLRLDPQQPDVFKQMQELEEYSRPETIGPQNNPSCKVSVIIATYNRPVEIREAIESVLAQTLKDYELIIVNDGGSGELETIVKSYGSDKIRYIALEKNIGHYAATNLAIEMSRGKYIAYLDDDDVYYPEHLEKLAEVLDNSPQKLVYSNTNAVEGKTVDGRFVEERKFYYWDQEYNRDKLAEKTFITNTTLMHRRNLLCDTGL